MVRHLWRHDIWISEKSKIDFLKNDKNFTEMKDPFSLLHKSSVKWQKGESRSACFKKKKNKAREIFRKTNISYPLTRTHANLKTGVSRKQHAKFSQKRTRTSAYQGVRNVRFSENLACIVFLKHAFWDLHFFLITDETLSLILKHKLAKV